MSHVETYRDIYLQERNEERFNRKHIDIRICDEILENAVVTAKMLQAEQLIHQYMAPEKPYYSSKQARVSQLATMDIKAMVIDLTVGLCYFRTEELFTSATAQLAARLKFSDRVEAITTVGELVALMAHADLCDVNKANRMASLMVVSAVPLSERLIEFVNNSQYLPPMVCTPLEVTHNFSSGYMTHNDSLILGAGNHHDGDLCLDVINKMSAVPLSLDTEFLSKVEETPTFDLDSQEKKDQWMAFKRQSYYFYSLMEQQGNRFYLNHKVDKRGRLYASGYHINTQGTSFKKAMLEFADPELIEGVPNGPGQRI